MSPEAASPVDRSGRQQLLIVAGCFFLSGFAALLYETVWLRQFSIYFGTSEQAVAIVLSTYMGGLALGSLLASWLAPRIRRPLLTYGVLELGIAATALMVPLALALVRQLQIMLFGQADAPPAADQLSQILFSFCGAFVATILPTTMMGATLPLLAKHVVRRDDHLGHRIGGLYAINTLGAVFGTVAAAFVCLPNLGLLRTVFVGVAINVLVLVIVWWMIRTSPPVSDSKAPESKAPEPSPGDEAQASPRWILWLIACSGLVSFTYEILFTRMLGHVLGGSLFAFAAMLASFLLGIAIGGGIAARMADNRRFAMTGFAYAQCGTVLLALLSWHTLERFAGHVNELARQNEALTIPRALIAILILLPPAITIGMSFPWAIRIHARDQRDAAKSSASVYAWNVVGGVLGAFLAGTYLLPLTNYPIAMSIALTANVIIAVSALVLGAQNLRHLVAVGVCVIVFVVALPTQPDELLRASSFDRFVRTGELIFVRTGRSGTITLHNDAGTFDFSTNGLPESSAVPKGSMLAPRSTTQWMAMLPALLRPESKSMLVVGFGGGVAPAWAPRTIRDIDVFELEAGMIEANELVGSERDRDPLSDPRINVIMNDGRSGLALTSKTYDVIVSQPSHPWTAGASHLYTREFAQLAREHLTDSGLFVLWMDCQFIDAESCRSLAASLGEVYPHISLFRPNTSALLFVGSGDPLELPETIPTPKSERDRRAYRQMGFDQPATLVAARVLDNTGLRKFCEGAVATSDNNNLLALRRIDPNRKDEIYEALDSQINAHDPLLSPAAQAAYSDLEWVRLVMRRESLRLSSSSDQLAAQGSELRSLFCRAALTAFRKQLVPAGELFAQLTQADADNLHAWLYRYILSNDPSLPPEMRVDEATVRARVPAPLSALVSAVGAVQSQNWPEMRKLDAELGRISIEDPLFEAATLMRIFWRNSDPGSGSQQQRGKESLELIEKVTPLASADDLLMPRVKAAALAGRPFVTLTTAQAVANSIRATLTEEKEEAVPSLDRETMRVQLINCLTAIAAYENDPRVPPHRFYGVRLFLQSQMELLMAGGPATE